MKVRIKQNYSQPQPDGTVWKDYYVGQEIEVTKEEFAENLHEQIVTSPKTRTVPRPTEEKE